LSFNKKTGTISGVPIVASDSVTYTVTAVGRHGRDTATVVITVGDMKVLLIDVGAEVGFIRDTNLVIT
jgi:hypothetical protein